MKKITFDPNKCIGCGFCTNACPKFFELKNGKSHIIGSKKEGEKDVLEISSDEDIDCAKRAEDVCPTKAIKIED